MSKILSYRNLMIDGGQDRILLSTKRGEVGYRIVKFRIMGFEPGADNYESIVKIYETEQTTATANIDFSQTTLLAAGFFTGDTTQQTMKEDTVIFDRKIINQDIYITYNDLQGSDAKVNYYIELETIKLSEQEAMVTTIQSIRNG